MTLTKPEEIQMSSRIDSLQKRVDELLEWMMKNPDKVIDERRGLQERMVKKRVIYGESPLPITVMPVFLKKESLKLVQETTLMMDRIVDKVINLYFQDPSIHEYFPSREIPREWMTMDPGYHKPTMINRLDMLFDGKTLKFIEFNCDNPGGRGWTDTYEQAFLSQPFFHDLIAEYTASPDRRILRSLYEALLACFHEMFPEEKPRVALVDMGNSGIRGEEEIVRDFFIENGVEANVIDARDLEYRDGKLWSNNVSFNLLQRSITAPYFLRFPREMKDFFRALQEKKVCLVNSFRACLGSEKALFSLLTNPFYYHLFTEEEVQALKTYIPWTRRLDETITLSPEGQEICIREYVKKTRERLVLKPSSGAGGYKVMVGRATERSEWEACVDENIGCSWWTVQEMVPIPKFSFPVIKERKIVLEDKFFNMSPYVIGGKYAGVLGRVSAKDVINVSAGGGVVPIFPLKES